MKTMNIFKRVKELRDEVNYLESKYDKLATVIRDLRKEEQERYLFNIIGKSALGEDDWLVTLLLEAKKRGFFDDNKCFSPAGAGSSQLLYKHHFSPILKNYRYDCDCFYIPAMGVGQNIFFGIKVIYRQGVWAKTKPIKP